MKRSHVSLILTGRESFCCLSQKTEFLYQLKLKLKRFLNCLASLNNCCLFSVQCSQIPALVRSVSSGRPISLVTTFLISRRSSVTSSRARRHINLQMIDDELADPGVDAICRLSLLLVLSFAPRSFSPGTPVFPSPQKPTFPNSSSTRNQVDEESLCGCATSKSLFIYLFIYLLKDDRFQAPFGGVPRWNSMGNVNISKYTELSCFHG